MSDAGTGPRPGPGSEPVSKPESNQDWPFDTWLRLAVLHMHMSPQDFWNISVRDWFALCHRQEAKQFSQINLAKLMQDFPDSRAENIS